MRQKIESLACPKCGHRKSDVKDSRPTPAVIRRTRACQACGWYFHTEERERTAFAEPEPPAQQSKPHGCVCPPTAEQTCGGLMCPRRAPRGALRAVS